MDAKAASKTLFQTLKESPFVAWPVLLGLIALWRYAALYFCPLVMVWALRKADGDYRHLVLIPFGELLDERIILAQCGVAVVCLALPMAAIGYGFGLNSRTFVAAVFVQFAGVVCCALFWVPKSMAIWNGMAVIAVAAPAAMLFVRRKRRAHSRIIAVNDDVRSLARSSPLAIELQYLIICALFAEVLVIIPAACGRWIAKVSNVDRVNPTTLVEIETRLTGNQVRKESVLLLWSGPNYVLVVDDVACPPPGESYSSSQPSRIAQDGHFLELDTEVDFSRWHYSYDELRYCGVRVRVPNPRLLRRSDILSIGAITHPMVYVREWLKKGQEFTGQEMESEISNVDGEYRAIVRPSRPTSQKAVD